MGKVESKPKKPRMHPRNYVERGLNGTEPAKGRFLRLPASFSAALGEG